MDELKHQPLWRIAAAFVAFSLAFSMTLQPAALAYAGELATASLSTASTSESANTFTFTNDGVTASDSAGKGFTISEDTPSTLTITKAGTYTITGSSTEGNVVVKKDIGDVTLVLDNLNLASSTTAPLLVKKAEAKGDNVSLEIVGDVTLTDNEDPATEDTNDDFEGAAIKVNKMDASTASAGNTLTIDGTGTLTVDGSNCKNGIKGGIGASVVINSGTVNVKAANNGIASDGSVIVNGGTINLGSENAPIGDDGIKSKPDGDDVVSAGLVEIDGGTITSYTNGDGIQASYKTADGTDKSATEQGVVKITGGTFNIVTTEVNDGASSTAGDGIQAEKKLSISGGTFNIKTWGGSSNGGTAGDGMNMPGQAEQLNTFETADAAVAAANNGDGISAKGLKASADETGVISITGGTFTIDTADDAIHSDGTTSITGGTFSSIKAGDDAIHADYQLDIGDSANTSSTQPVINVVESVEGFEAAKVNVYSGTNTIYYSDDGINAANKDFGDTSTKYSFLITIAGGTNKVISTKMGDCLDSNGSIVISGGTTFLNSWASGDGDVLDAGDLNSDTVKVTGGKLLGLGHSVGNAPSEGAYVLFGASAGTGATGPGNQGGFGFGDQQDIQINPFEQNESGQNGQGNQSGPFNRNGQNSQGNQSNPFGQNGQPGQDSQFGQRDWNGTTNGFMGPQAITDEESPTELSTQALSQDGAQNQFGGLANDNRGFGFGGQGSLSIAQGASVSVTDGTTSLFTETATNSASMAIYCDPALQSDTTYQLMANGESIATGTPGGSGTTNPVITPTQPTQPDQPTLPNQPNQPTQPTQPSNNTETNANENGNSNTTEKTDSNTSNTSTNDATTSIDISKATIASIADKKYTGSAIKPKLTVTLNGSELVSGTDYTLLYSNNTNVGTATITITGKGAYQGTKTVTFKIVKAANTMKVSKKTASVSSTLVASKARSAKAITVKAAKGKVTYKRVSGSKRLKVNTSTGRIIVKKGTPAGTYKLKVKVTAKGNSNYKSKSKTITVKVKVK